MTRLRALRGIALAALCPLLPATAAGEAGILSHPAAPPAGSVLPADPRSWLYLEGETPSDDAPPDASHAPRTLFRVRQSPDDRWWGRFKLYDGTRAGMRGAHVDQPWHALGWEIPPGTLAPGEYEAWARLFLSPDGEADLSFTPGMGDGSDPSAAFAAFAASGPDDGAFASVGRGGLSWTLAGRFPVGGENGAPLSPALRVRTRKSAVCVDCVLLVRIDPDTRRADLRYDPGSGTPPDWRRGGGLVFAADRATLAFSSRDAAGIREVRATVRRSPDPAAPAETHTLAPDPASPGRWFLDLPGRGWYDIAVAAETGRGLPGEVALRAAVTGAPIPEEWRERSVFGIWSVHGDPALIRLAGARWNRRMASFRDVTPEQAAEDGGLGGDAAARPAARAPYDVRDGLREVGVFSFGMPLWTMDMPSDAKMPSFGNPFYPASDWDAVSRAVAAYARTHDLPRDFAMYNEPLAHFKGAPAQLADYARAIRRGLKAADPSFRVGGPGLYSIRIGDLEKIEAGGLLDSLDFLEMHAYVGGTPPEGEFADKIGKLNEWLAAHGRADMPVYLTEFGWTAAPGTWQPPVDRVTQARYVARSLALAWSQGVDALVFFVLDYRARNPGDDAFLLVDGDGRPEAGYSAFAAVSRAFVASAPLGHWILAPGVHLVAGTRDGRLQLALWGERDGLPAIRLPWRVDAATDLYGAPLAPAESWTPTPDVLFLEAPLDAPLASLPSLEPLKGVAPPTLDLAGTNVLWAVAALAGHPLPPDLPDGPYAAFVRAPDGETAIRPFVLAPPARPLDAVLFWSENADRPRMVVPLEFGVEMDLAAIAVSADLGVLSIPPSPAGDGTAAAGETRTVELPLPGDIGALSGTRLRGEASLWMDGAPFRAVPVDCTLLAVWPEGSDAPWADFTQWAPYGWKDGEPPDAEIANAAKDCAARVRLFHSPKGLRAEVEVEDDEHAPATGDPSLLWSRDSLQFGFDLDWALPWQAGFAGAGNSQTLGGHRVFEFSVAGSGDGATGTVFLERSWDDSLPAGSVREAVRAEVARTGAITRYSVFFPWDQIGAPDEEPIPATVVGFSLAVNDVDPARAAPRRALRLFGGIVDEKEPARYGPAWIRK